MEIAPVESSIWTKLRHHEKWASFMISLEGVLTLLLLVNIIYLNLYLFDNGFFSKPAKNTIKSPVLTTTPSPAASPTPVISSSPKSTARTATVIQESVKDYYVSLGSGTNQSSDWTNVPGVQAVIDFGQYPHIKEIHFEASIYVPTANEWVSVRLYNETDKHPVWNSEVTTNAATTAYLTSPALDYNTGSKLYQVQMRTQLKAPATLVQSRIHIILK